MDKTQENLERIQAYDEDIWRTIRGAKVLIDEGTGEIKGGAGGKMNGMKYKPSFGKNAKTGKKVLAPSIHAKPAHHVYKSKAELFKKLKGAVEPPKTKTKEEVWEAYKPIYYSGLWGAKTLEQLDDKKKEMDQKYADYVDIYNQLDKSTLTKNPDMDYDSAYEQLSKEDHLETLKKSLENDYKYAKNHILQKQATAKAKDVWQKVIKYKTAMGAAKTVTGKMNNQQKLAEAFKEYKAAVAESPYGKVDFKPKTSSVEALLVKSPADLGMDVMAKKQKNAAPASTPSPTGPANVQDPFATPLTDPDFTDRQLNIQNTIETLKKLTEAAKSSNSKYAFQSFQHLGADGFKKTPLPSDSMGTHKQLVGKASEAWKKATPAEKQAIYDYTGSYSKFNEPLRGIEYGTSNFKGIGKIDMDNIGVNSYGHFKKGQVKKLINDMTDMIDKSSYDHDIQVRRGLSFSGASKLLGVDPKYLKPGNLQALKSAVEGKLCTEFGFCSTGVASNKGFTNQVELRILCPAGTKMMYAEPFSKYGHGDQSAYWDGTDTQTSTGSEQEMILQRNTRFQVQRVTFENGKPVIALQVVAQDPVQFD